MIKMIGLNDLSSKQPICQVACMPKYAKFLKILPNKYIIIFKTKLVI